MPTDLKGVFKSRYPQLSGADWIRRLEPEDLKAFIQIGMQAWDYGRMGGEVRAKTCKRDNRGRFAKNA